MSFLQRPRRTWLVGGWLVCQLLMTGVTPAALCAAASNVRPAVECTCAHGDGQVCPMHHAAPKSKDSCSCRGTTSDMSIATLLGPVGVLPVALESRHLFLVAKYFSRSNTVPFDFARIPDSPPPRS